MENKIKVELYVLKGCDKCSRIKYILQADEIAYEEIDCSSSENKKCDTLEDKVDCGKYPMAVIKKKGSTTMIHFCDGRSTGGTTTVTRRIPVDSEYKFIYELKKVYI
jgi:glutaredoxin